MERRFGYNGKADVEMVISANNDRPQVADSGLSHCNIIIQCNELGQKAANDQTRPFLVSRDVVVQRPLRSKCGHSAPDPRLPVADHLFGLIVYSFRR